METVGVKGLNILQIDPDLHQSALVQKPLELSVAVWVGLQFNAAPDTTCVISKAVFTASHLTDTDKQNSIRKYTN